MLCVFPVHAGDWAALKRLLAWIEKLGGCKGHDALIMADAGLPWNQVLEAGTAAKPSFAKVFAGATGQRVNGWVPGANSLWEAAAAWASKSPYESWLWMEPDAVPMRAGWLDEIAAAYEKSNAAYLGQIYTTDKPNYPPKLLSGIAVYPANAIEDWKKVLHVRSFDVELAPVVVPKALHTPLIRHIQGQTGNPPVFVEKAVKGTNMFQVEQFREAAIFHRVKDGSLIKMLESRLGKREVKSYAKPSLAIVQTGRYGDIINILPLAKHLAEQRGEPVALVAAQAYADVVDGCSYVKPVVYPGKFNEVKGAIKLAESQFKEVIVSQVYGDHRDHRAPANVHCESYCQEAWRLAGYYDLFGKLPLVFDRRNAEREAALAAMSDWSKPVAILNLRAHTSPWKEPDLLRQLFDERWTVIELTEAWRSERIYDLLGLYDRAAVLLTIDTATLHLAAASGVPTIELLSDQPFRWIGSMPKGRRCLYAPLYSQVDYAAMRAALDRALRLAKPSVTFLTFPYDGADKAMLARQEQAQRHSAGVVKEAGWFPAPMKAGDPPRTLSEGQNKLPYVKDIFDWPAYLDLDDWMVFSNSDIVLTAAFTRRAAELMRRGIPFCARRNEFDSLKILPPEDQLANKRRAFGLDVFGFPVAWWKAHRDKMPDMVLAREAWDMVLGRIICDNGGEMLYDCVCHEYHIGLWQKPDNRRKLKGQAHNRKLAGEWCQSNGIDPAVYGFPRENEE